MEIYKEIVDLKTCTVRMEGPDVVLVDSLRNFIEETEGYQASRSEFLYSLIKKAMWQIIIEEKEKMGAVYNLMEEELTYDGFLQHLLGENYSPRYLVDIPVFEVQDDEDPEDVIVEDMSKRLLIPLENDHPLIEESDIARREWFGGKYHNWIEEKIGGLKKAENE